MIPKRHQSTSTFVSVHTHTKWAWTCEQLWLPPPQHFVLLQFATLVWQKTQAYMCLHTHNAHTRTLLGCDLQDQCAKSLSHTPRPYANKAEGTNSLHTKHTRSGKSSYLRPSLQVSSSNVSPGKRASPLGQPVKKLPSVLPGMVKACRHTHSPQDQMAGWLLWNGGWGDRKGVGQKKKKTAKKEIVTGDRERKIENLKLKEA